MLRLLGYALILFSFVLFLFVAISGQSLCEAPMGEPCFSTTNPEIIILGVVAVIGFVLQFLAVKWRRKDQ
jgi:hypothetical protein